MWNSSISKKFVHICLFPTNALWNPINALSRLLNVDWIESNGVCLYVVCFSSHGRKPFNFYSKNFIVASDCVTHSNKLSLMVLVWLDFSFISMSDIEKSIFTSPTSSENVWTSKQSKYCIVRESGSTQNDIWPWLSNITTIDRCFFNNFIEKNLTNWFGIKQTIELNHKEIESQPMYGTNKYKIKRNLIAILFVFIVHYQMQNATEWNRVLT